jgi:predicted RNA binding protein with dsRBD fold (UPF0201 family)
MISEDHDSEKAAILLKHLAISSKSYEEKDESRKKVKDQIEKIKKLSKTPALRRQLLHLEEMLHKTLEREKNILRHQHIEEVAQKTLKHRIEELEIKLSKYLATRKSRMRRINQLERKIGGDLRKKSKEVDKLRRQVLAIEQLYKKLRSEGGYPSKKLSALKKKIASLKKKTKKKR